VNVHFAGRTVYFMRKLRAGEVAVPVLQGATAVRGQKAKDTAVRKAQVTVLGTKLTITTNR